MDVTEEQNGRNINSLLTVTNIHSHTDAARQPPELCPAPKVCADTLVSLDNTLFLL